ncbi:MAG: DUF1127 domain-containing protein [Pseudomonadota bacterium]
MITRTHAHSRTAARAGAPSAIDTALRTLTSWTAVAAERRALRDADDAMLNDIGVSRAAAERESERPFWDLPRGR